MHPQIPQNGDGLLNFTAIRREHSGWYKCTARHLNKPYSSFGYFLNVRCEYARWGGFLLFAQHGQMLFMLEYLCCLPSFNE